MNNAVLNNDQSRLADTLTIAEGTSGIDLMAHAGLAVARIVQNEYPNRPVSVLTGPGNNGGDGIVAAIELSQAGCQVQLVVMHDLYDMPNDAQHFADQWTGDTIDMIDFSPKIGEVIVDGLFGSGMNRALPEVVQQCFSNIHADNPVIAIDMPSGVHGDTGRVLGAALHCQHTVTFFQLKPGHLLYPGRELCGTTHICDIGISDDVLANIEPDYFCNGTPNFSRLIPNNQIHKYTRGCLGIIASGTMCGASQLAARAAQRSGTGLVYLLSPTEAQYHYQQVLASVAVLSCPSPREIIRQASDDKIKALVIGPGLTSIEDDPGLLAMLLELEKPTVIDASAITALAQRPELLKERSAPLVLTPHGGEFRRLFPDVDIDNAPRALQILATGYNCVILYKGHTSLIASPDGKVAFNINARADLATAGSGDVLSGVIGSLLAQGWPAGEATRAACWWHAEAGSGFGLIAEDIIDSLPTIAKFHIRKSS